jgi:hypothetical protein
MIRALAVSIFAFAVSIGSCGAQLPLAKKATYQRTAIEAFPEDERRPLLEWLDAARVVADRSAQQFASGHSQDVFNAMEATARALGEGADVKNLAREMRRVCGTVTGYEYRAQVLEEPRRTPDGHVHDVAHATSTVYYALQTTRRSAGLVVLAIQTRQVAGEHRVLFASFNRYGSQVPDWLQVTRPGAR